jgi:hypothetical protein
MLPLCSLKISLDKVALFRHSYRYHFEQADSIVTIIIMSLRKSVKRGTCVSHCYVRYKHFVLLLSEIILSVIGTVSKALFAVALWHTAEWHSAECHLAQQSVTVSLFNTDSQILTILVPNFILLNVVPLIVILLYDIMLHFVLLNVVRLIVILFYAIMLHFILMNVVRFIVILLYAIMLLVILLNVIRLMSCSQVQFLLKIMSYFWILQK